MAVTVTDIRTTANEADDTTGWSSPVGGEALTVFTADPNPVEATGSIGMAVSIETSDIVYSTTYPDLTDKLIYVWVLANGTMDTTANGGVALILGDSAATPNIVGYHLAGSDVAAFRHEAGPVGWQCLVLDTSNLPTSKTQLNGTVDPPLTGITKIGAMYKTLSKALGGASNCFTDVIRYGNGGLRITGGTSGDTGKFSEIAADDRSSTSGKAYGTVRELGTGLYGVQGPLTFGDTAGTAPTYFADTNAVVAFEDRSLGTTKYFITVQGNATGSTTFQLGTQVGTTTSGANGCTLVCPSGVGASFTATDPDLQILKIFGSTLSGFNNGISLSTSANASNHELYDNAFISCGQIDPGKTQFKNNSISSTTDSTTGAILLDADGTGGWSDLSFTSGGTGHAIYITAPGTYTFSNFTYNGYGANDTTDAVVYNNSGGSVTINVSGGDSPTVRNGAGASTNVINTKTLQVKVLDADNSPVEGAQVWIQKDPDGNGAADYGHPGNPFNSATTGNNQGGSTFTVDSGQAVPGDLPSAGWLVVGDVTGINTEEHSYRYVSRSGQVFTLRGEVTGTDNGTGDATTINETGIGAKDIVEGDAIRNTTANPDEWAIVLSVSTDSVTTTPLSGGSSWASASYSVHRLVESYDGSDRATVPLMSKETDASGIATEEYNYGGPMDTVVRVRRSSTLEPQYIPISTRQQIGNNGLDLTLTATEDYIRTP